METILYSKIKDPKLFKEFKIILAIQGRTIKEVSNKFISDYVKKNKKIREGK